MHVVDQHHRNCMDKAQTKANWGRGTFEIVWTMGVVVVMWRQFSHHDRVPLIRGESSSESDFVTKTKMLLKGRGRGRDTQTRDWGPRMQNSIKSKEGPDKLIGRIGQDQEWSKSYQGWVLENLVLVRSM